MKQLVFMAMLSLGLLAMAEPARAVPIHTLDGAYTVGAHDREGARFNHWGTHVGFVDAMFPSFHHIGSFRGERTTIADPTSFMGDPWAYPHLYSWYDGRTSDLDGLAPKTASVPEPGVLWLLLAGLSAAALLRRRRVEQRSEI